MRLVENWSRCVKVLRRAWDPKIGLEIACMNADFFLDTNILVYALDSTAGSKQARALEIIETVNFGISTQVVQAFYVTVTRKFAIPLSAEKSVVFIDYSCGR